IQVTTGGYEAEFGRSQGAVVNVVTNSGSNQFHGEVVGFYTGNHLRASPRWGLIERPVDRFTHYDFGVGLGGPIRRDRLWWYAAWNPLFEQKDGAYTGLPVLRDRLVRHLFAGKLTWVPEPTSELAFTVLGDPTSREGVEGYRWFPPPLPTILDSGVVLSDNRNGGWAATLRFRKQFGARVFLTAAASRLSRVDRHVPRHGAEDPYPLTRYDDYVTNTSSGGFSGSFRSHMG